MFFGLIKRALSVDGKLYFKAVGWVEMPERMSIDEFKKINRGRSSQQRGEAGELLVRAALQKIGLKQIEKIHTPWRIIRDDKGKVIDAVPLEKVEGDFVAIDPNTGKKVLVESKWRQFPRLAYGDVKIHQHRSMFDNDAYGGISILAWVRDGRVKLMRYPVLKFEPNKSIKWAEATEIKKL
jgi:hypothetical protein